MHLASLATALALLVLTHTTDSQDNCQCLNGGTCTAAGRCHCLPNFIGNHCHIPAQPITYQLTEQNLSSNYTYLYFDPQQVNFYKLNFTVCMLDNPQNLATLFYIQTEKSNGSLREAPSFFETAKLVMGDNGCVDFMTHYISIKRREDNTYRRIVVGLKPMSPQDTHRYLNVYRSDGQAEEPLPSLLTQPIFPVQPEISQDISPELITQKITIKMTYDLYLQTNYYGSYVVLLASFALLILLTALVNCIRKKYNEREEEAASSEDFRFDFRPNPEREEVRRRKSNLTVVDVFMPATIYREGSKYFLSELLVSCKQDPKDYPEHDTCSICLMEFEEEDHIRMTPCKHRYHKQCIDNWCQSNLSCPVCRRALNFTRQIHRIYYHYLRGELTVC